MIPLWVQRMPAIWIAASPGLDPRMPAGATTVSLEQARAVTTGAAPFPIELARAWTLGATIAFPDDASPEVRAVAERLRLMLPEASRAALPQLGAQFRLPRAAAAMAAHPTIPTPAELADAVADSHPDGIARLNAEGRLLRALCGL